MRIQTMQLIFTWVIYIDRKMRRDDVEGKEIRSEDQI
jgi:hypothetical protein